MKLKNAAAVILSLFLCISLCGCKMFTADTAELLSPPELTGDIAPIASAISASAGGEYTLKYPSVGNYRSAVVQNDVDGDGIMEAFAFYSMTEDESTVMYVNVICSENGKWKSVAKQKIVAGGVDRVDFCDLDGDGISEILIGWEIYGTSEMQMAVYSFKNDELNRRMLQQYTHFLCGDIDEDGNNEVTVIMINSGGTPNTATVYRLNENGVTALYSAELDRGTKTVNEPIYAHLSSGKPAIYIDEIKGVGAVTEVLFIEKNKLVNPLFNTETGETSATLRSANFAVQDINNDGIIEIPVQHEVPAVNKTDVTEKIYLTDWCSYNGETLTPQISALMNTNDGYYYIVPSKLTGQIAVYKNTDRHLREIYRYAGNTVGELLFTIKTVKKADWDNERYAGRGFSEITHDGISSYICSISETGAADGMTVTEIRQNFRLID